MEFFENKSVIQEIKKPRPYKVFKILYEKLS